MFREEIKIGANRERIVVTIDDTCQEVVMKEYDPWNNVEAHQYMNVKTLDNYIEALQKAQKELVKRNLLRSFHAAIYKSK